MENLSPRYVYVNDRRQVMTQSLMFMISCIQYLVLGVTGQKEHFLKTWAEYLIGLGGNRKSQRHKVITYMI